MAGGSSVLSGSSLEHTYAIVLQARNTTFCYTELQLIAIVTMDMTFSDWDNGNTPHSLLELCATIDGCLQSSAQPRMVRSTSRCKESDASVSVLSKSSMVGISLLNMEHGCISQSEVEVVVKQALTPNLTSITSCSNETMSTSDTGALYHKSSANNI